MKPLHWNIEEPFTFNWRGEYVYLDLPSHIAEQGARDIRSVTDPGGRRTAAQFDPERNALAVRIDLAADSSLELIASDEPAESTGLHVETRSGVHVLRNGRMSIALASEAIVVDADDRWIVTGPIAFVEGPDTIPRCASRLVVKKSPFLEHDRRCISHVNAEKIAAEERIPTVEIHLDEIGEVFIRYHYVLKLFSGRTYRFCATLMADDPVLYVTEETDLGHDGDLEVFISDGFDCDTYFRGGTDISDPQSLVPIPLGRCRLGSLTPHHTQTQMYHAWLGFMISDRPQGSFRGRQETSLEPYSDAIAVMAYRPIQWRYPSEIGLQFTVENGQRVTARGPLRRGLRTWCLLVQDRSEVLAPLSYNMWDSEDRISLMAQWHKKLNDVPLDWARRLDLNSGTVGKDSFPQSVLTRDELNARRDGVFDQLSSRMRDRIAELREECLPGDEGHIMTGLYARWVVCGEAEAIRELAGLVEKGAERQLALFLNSGFLSGRTSGPSQRHHGPMAVYFEACVASGVYDPQQVRRLHRALLLVAHATAGDAMYPRHQNFLPPHDPNSIRNSAIVEHFSDGFGGVNFQTDVYYNLGLLAAVFHEHPQSRAWFDDAAQELDRQLDLHFHPGGVYLESINYFQHVFKGIVHLASVLKRHGVRDFFADDRMQEAMNTLVDYLTAPVEPTVEQTYEPGHMGCEKLETEGKCRFWPGIGDTGGVCKDQPISPALAHAAWEVREHNKELSDKLLAAWNECGRPLWGLNEPHFEFLYLQEAEPEAPPLAPLLASRHFKGVGVQLRADVGMPTETSVFVRTGPATHHWGFDFGNISISTRGSRLIPEFGYHGSWEEDGEPLGGRCSWLHNIVTFGPDYNGGMGVELHNAPRTVRIGEDLDYIVCDLTMNNLRHKSYREFRPIETIRIYRHVLFAHNRYVFVWDRIERSIYRSQLRINCLSTSVRMDGNRLHFTGLDGVDLVVHVLHPRKPEFHEALVGPMRYVLLEQDCELDYTWLCQPLGSGETAFAVEAGANRVSIKGRDVHGNEFEDTIVYAKGEFGATTNVGGKTMRLDGRLAMIRHDERGRRLELLDAESLAP